jgi:hypothetical protein
MAIQKNSNNTFIVVITDRRPQLISSIHQMNINPIKINA